ncbi:MAG: class I SAM-dependent methyltransferase [Alphaproteobacteria bacterium]
MNRPLRTRLKGGRRRSRGAWPVTVGGILTLMTDEEWALVERTARAVHARFGRVTAVEIGCWLGGSTAALARGLSAVPAGDWGLHVFDAFRWRKIDVDKVPFETVPLRQGNDFFPLWSANTAPWRGKTRVHRGELLHAAWDGAPIHLLFLDAPKEDPLVAHVFATFASALCPDGILIAQDYDWHGSRDLRRAIGAMGLTETARVVNGTMRVFRRDAPA